MTFQEFDSKLKEVYDRLKKQAEENKKKCKNSIMRPVPTPISS